MGTGLYAVTFQYPGISEAVSVVGSFNQWSPEAHPLRRVDGEWRLTLFLPAGTYPYAFVVAGRITRDPIPGRELHGPLGDRYSVLQVPDGPSPAIAA